MLHGFVVILLIYDYIINSMPVVILHHDTGGIGLRAGPTWHAWYLNGEGTVKNHYFGEQEWKCFVSQ